MIDKSIRQYSEELKKLGIRHEIAEHPELRTPAEVQGYLGLTLADGLSTMIMKADDRFVAIIRRDDCRLDFDKIRKAVGAKSIRMAKPDEFKEVTGMLLGAARVVNPGMRTFLDKKLFEKDLLTGGSGSFECSIRYKANDLKRIPNSVVADLIEGVSGGIQRVLSGIRATGRLHLGNYLGAVKGMLALQKDPAYETLYMVADVHTITTPYEVEELRRNRREVIIDYLAAGLDPEKSVIFLQADVNEHMELAFYFSSVMSVARMQHLPTFKEKVKQYPEHVTMALLNYPVLMAADILVYKASAVPVGIDQEPHLEVAREIARKMNEQYGMDFPKPKRFATKGEYIPSLTGEGKMSKTVEGSYIQLTDDLETIKQRLAAAPTDSGKGAQVPTSGGVANLLMFVELFQGKGKREEYEKMYQVLGIKYQVLKQELAEAIYKELEPIQKRRGELTDKYVDEVIKDGAERARAIAKKTVEEVRQKMGLG